MNTNSQNFGNMFLKDAIKFYKFIYNGWQASLKADLIESWNVGISHAFAMATIELDAHSCLFHYDIAELNYEEVLHLIENFYSRLKRSINNFFKNGSGMGMWGAAVIATYCDFYFRITQLFNKYNINIENWETEVED